MIIGAGPAGLGVAHRLYELGVLCSKTQVIVFEQDKESGHSYRDQHGFLWDTGPYSFSSQPQYYNAVLDKAVCTE